MQENNIFILILGNDKISLCHYDKIWNGIVKSLNIKLQAENIFSKIRIKTLLSSVFRKKKKRFCCTNKHD